jgi:hypothetical protein
VQHHTCYDDHIGIFTSSSNTVPMNQCYYSVCRERASSPTEEKP